MAGRCYDIIKQIILCIYLIVNNINGLSVRSNVERIRDIPISGNRSIEECVHGKPYWETKSELYITTSQFIRKLGYPAEDHLILTEDGYLLTIHRIPGAEGSQPVILLHGMTTSSFDFVVSGKNKSLALELADKGYDVWMPNSRGNTYSQCHTRLTTSDTRYWNFSFHEIGVFDVPAEISYVTNVTNQKVICLGHSMGNTIFHIMAIERPDIASKVKAMFVLANIAFMSHIISPFSIISSFPRLWKLYGLISKGPLFQQTAGQSLLEKQFILNGLLLMVGGFDTAYSDLNVLHQVWYHTPSGISYKVFNHILQIIKAGRFQYYDYGRKGNLRMYNNKAAPDYDISKINVPMAFFAGQDDRVATVTDMTEFFERLPNKIVNYKIKDPQFNHMDFLWGIRASQSLYPPLLSFMEKYKDG